jgi:LysM repeat protein
MTSHSPTRWLAPIALVASLLAVLLIYTNTVGGGDEPAADTTAAQATPAEGEAGGSGGAATTGEGADAPAAGGTGTTTGAETGPRTYRVRPGDTLGAIAERTGVSVERLTELNPDADAQSLTVGQTLRLRGGG